MPTVSPSMAHYLFFLGLVLPCIRASLISRSIETTAICSSNFSWADNEEGASPCLLAAYTSAACGSGDWLVSALANDSHYDVPIEKANACACSWATYNLLMACTACQDMEGSIQNWAYLNQNCTNYESSTTYFPADTPLGDSLTIPYWAGVHPSTWNAGRFDVTQAQTLAQEGKPDYSTTTPAASKKSNVGAIAGGVVGGVAALCIVSAIVFYFVRKRRQQRKHVTVPTHERQFSNVSSQMFTTSQGYTNTNKLTPPLPSPTTILSHRPSASSLSYFGSGVGSNFTTPSPRAPSSHVPQISVSSFEVGRDGIVSSIPIVPENIIDPFLLPSPPPRNVPLHKERPVDLPVDNAPVTSGPSRPRMNPPAYSTEPQTSGSGSPPGLGRTGKGSHDSQASLETTRLSVSRSEGSANFVSSNNPRSLDDAMSRMGSVRTARNDGNILIA